MAHFFKKSFLAKRVTIRTRLSTYHKVSHVIKVLLNVTKSWRPVVLCENILLTLSILRSLLKDKN